MRVLLGALPGAWVQPADYAGHPAYGSSLSLEFVTLVVLRIREPNLKREFKVPGGLVGVVLAGAFPLALLSLALVKSESEKILGINGLVFGVLIILTGFVVYAATGRLRVKTSSARGAFESGETA